MQDSFEDLIANNLRNDDKQKQIAQTIESQLFTKEQNKIDTFTNIHDFLEDYLLHGQHTALNTWLLKRFDLYSEIWQHHEEKQLTTQTIIDTIETFTQNLLEIRKNLQKGKTLPNILNKKINQIAQDNALNTDDLIKQINESIAQENQQYTKWITGQNIATESINSSSTLEKARKLSNDLLHNANLKFSLYGVNELGEHIANTLKNKQNTNIAELLRPILNASFESAENKGIQAALAAAILISNKKQQINLFDESAKSEEDITQQLEKVRIISLETAETWQEVRLLDRIEKGAHHLIDAGAEKAKIIAAKFITGVEKTINYALKSKGMKLLSNISTKLPFLAPLSPIISGYLTDIADKNVTKPLAETARKIAHKSIDYVANSVKKGASLIKKGVKRVFNFFSK